MSRRKGQSDTPRSARPIIVRQARPGAACAGAGLSYAEAAAAGSGCALCPRAAERTTTGTGWGRGRGTPRHSPLVRPRSRRIQAARVADAVRDRAACGTIASNPWKPPGHRCSSHWTPACTSRASSSPWSSQPTGAAAWRGDVISRAQRCGVGGGLHGTWCRQLGRAWRSARKDPVDDRKQANSPRPYRRIGLNVRPAGSRRRRGGSCHS